MTFSDINLRLTCYLHVHWPAVRLQVHRAPEDSPILVSIIMHSANSNGVLDSNCDSREIYRSMSSFTS